MVSMISKEVGSVLSVITPISNMAGDADVEDVFLA